MRTCNARPWIVYILFREDRLFLREENPKFFLFQGGGGPRLAVCRFLVDCKHSRRAYLSFLKVKIKILKEYFLVLSLFIVWLFPVVRVEVSGEGTCK